MSASAPSSPAPSSLFNLPGISRTIENKENNDGITTVPLQASQVTATGYVPMKQTDVIQSWELQLTYAQTLTPGTGTITVGAYFPWSVVGPGNLNMQNQFNTLQWAHGYDVLLWQMIRPLRHQTNVRTQGYATPQTSLYNQQAALVTSLAAYTTATTSMKLRYEMPVGQWFDVFYPLAGDGTIVGPGLRAFASPQYMAGTSRIIQPNIAFFPAFGTTGDLGPYTATGVATATALLATQNWKRRGWYQPLGAADSPPVFNWQYTRRSSQVSLAGVSTKTIPIPINGQILSIAYRFYDPSAAAGVGAPIALSALTEVDLNYGSGLFKYQDYPVDSQARLIQQHSFLPAEGIIVHDMAVDEADRITNKDCLNTMNTSGVQAQVNASSPFSATAYVQVLVEALTYVEAG
jgi:hypothetical protein